MSFYIPHLCDEPSNKRILNSTHEKIVLNISKLIKELNLDNVHEQFYAFCYLLWNGYFSIDKKYFYNNVDIKDEENTIFLGRGCCRHNSKLLAEVFDALPFLYDSGEFRRIIAKEIGIRLFEFDLTPIMNVDFEIEENDYNESDYKKDECDHSVTVVSTDTGAFLFDPTLLTECEILKRGKLLCVNGEYIVNKKIFRRGINYELAFHHFSKKNTITKDEIIYSYNRASDICINNKKIFNDFYDDNHKNYEKIKQLII